MRILFLSRWFPAPPHNGSKLRIYNLLKGLATRHEITLLSFAEGPPDKSAFTELQAFCPEIHTVPWKPFDPLSKRARLGFFQATPRSISDTFSPELRAKLGQSLAGGQIDLIIASQVDMAAYSRYFGGAPALFEEAEVGVLHEQYARAVSPWRRFRHGLTWAKHRRFLQTILQNFRACTVVSERERQLLAEIAPPGCPVAVVPNCIDPAAYADCDEIPQPNTLVFTGSFSYPPNHEAMVWFLGKVYPLILERVPNVRFSITGDHARQALPPAPHVDLTGFVEDVRPIVARAWVSVAPVLTGGGTRLKILEAMALHTPVVATSKGAEGLEVEPGVHLLLADTPEAFADAICRLFSDPVLRQKLTLNANQLVRGKYNWEVVTPRILELVEQAANA